MWKSVIDLDPQFSSSICSMAALDYHSQNYHSRKQGTAHVVIDTWHKLGKKTPTLLYLKHNKINIFLILFV